MICQNCQASDLPDFSRFCAHCGSAVNVPGVITEGDAARPGDGAANQARSSQAVSRAVAVALGCLTLLVAIAIVWEAGPWKRYIALVPLPNDLGQQAAALHDKLEGYERSADTLKTLVTFMISLSTLYALALALNAYLGVQEATKRAEDKVKSLNELEQNAKAKYDRDLLDIRREFPLFREMQSRIGDIRNALGILIPEGGFGEEAFNQIDHADKVRIAHYEQTVASFEFFNLAPFREDASKIYQLLGSFHSHKWLLDKEKERLEKKNERLEEEAFRKISAAEKVRIAHYERTVASLEFVTLAPFRKDPAKVYQLLGSFHNHRWLLEKKKELLEKKKEPLGKKKAPVSDEADKHWARFYLTRSNDLKKDDVATLNELGYFELKVTTERDLARKHLKISRDLDSRQQRPRYFLSIIEHFAGDEERRKGNAEAAKQHYSESVAILSAALLLKRWQQEDQEERVRHADFFKRMNCYMYYNRACARARLAEFENDPAGQLKLRQDAVADLKSAFPSGTAPKHAEQLARDFTQDANAGGDLSALIESPSGHEVEQLLERVKTV